MYRLFVLAGPSGVGKSTMLFKLADTGSCEVAPKYSERPERQVRDDIIHVDDIYDCTHSCDIVYKMYNTRYGINTVDIRHRLQTNNQVVIIGDIESLKRMRAIFGSDVTVIYIFPADSSLETLIEVSISRGELTLSTQEKGELISIAQQMAKLIRVRNDKKFRKLDEQFCDKLREHFVDLGGFGSFVKRYKAWTKAREFFNRNADLFDLSFDGNMDFFPELHALIVNCKPK